MGNGCTSLQSGKSDETDDSTILAFGGKDGSGQLQADWFLYVGIHKACSIAVFFTYYQLFLI